MGTGCAGIPDKDTGVVRLHDTPLVLCWNYKKERDMKTRQGFVSNSSSTSFCVFGLQKSIESLEEVEEKVYDTDCPLEIFWGDPNGWERSVYIGVELCEMDRDETRAQFEQKIVDAIEKIFPGEGGNCSVYEESYYNG